MAKSKKTDKTSKIPSDIDSENLARIDDDEITQAPNVDSDAIEDAVEIASDEQSSDPDNIFSDSIDAETVDDVEDAGLDDAPVEEDTIPDGENAIEEDVAENDPDPQIHQTVAAAPAESRSIFFPLVLGGLVAAFLGFLVGQEGLLFKRPMVPDHTNAVNELRGDVDKLRVQLSEFDLQIKAMLDSADLAPVEKALTDIDDRLADLEKRPVPTQGDAPDYSGALSGALEGFSEEFDALKSQSATQQAEIARLLDEVSSAKSSAAESEKVTLARAALSQVQVAFDAGRPFDAPLNDLDAMGFVEIPDILKDTAADGVTSMANLQSQVPDAARAALSAARSEHQDGEGIGGFLQRQLGIRSLEPTEGDDADAVLSRVEAAINDNRLTDALTEVELLPEGARAALGDWLTHAETRASAASAVETLLQSLPTN
ncbi:MAG: hypothetical protein ABJD13_09895 [Paracoccaceae bacterium]